MTALEPSPSQLELVERGRDMARSIQGNLARRLYRSKDAAELQDASDLLWELANVLEDYSAAADYWQRMYEQTVLERRTCTNGVKPGVGVMPRLYCSNCGCYTTLNKPDNATSYSESFMDWPFYCGNCGARVEGES